jgi:hypothetical protein
MKCLTDLKNIIRFFIKITNGKIVFKEFDKKGFDGNNKSK